MTRSNPASGSRRAIKTGVSLVVCIAAGWLAFRLFEPMFVWSSGWQALPDAAAMPAPTGMADPQWRATAAEADVLLREAREHLNAPALSVAIMIDGVRVWSAATGYADIANGRRADLSTAFRLGSTSKALNALAVGRMIDTSKLDIERPIREYLPELPESYAAVTTRLAISHTAGVPEYGACLCFPIWEHLNRQHFDNARDALRVFADRPLLFAPGEGFAYSSYGTNLTGAVVETLAGKAYPEAVDTLVFEPLHMAHSRADVVDADNPQRAMFYEVAEGRYKPAFRVDNSIRYPSGGLLSTPSDMLVAGHAFLDDSLLHEATRKRLLTRQTLRDGSDNPQGYALGIRVFDDKKMLGDTVATTFYSHHGTAVGSTSYFGIYPEYRLVVSAMMNKGQENLDAMAPEINQIVELFLAETIRRQQPTTP